MLIDLSICFFLVSLFALDSGLSAINKELQQTLDALKKQLERHN